jgi:hypothetical protein
MQEFSQMVYTTSEQHKESTYARMNRDKADREMLIEKLADFSPFTGDATLCNIITGINANDDVNVDDLFAVGNSTVKTMEGQSIFSYLRKRNTRVKTLATAGAIKITEDRTIDPALLFQRFLVVSQSGHLNLSEVMEYELSPYPPSLFEAKDCLCKTDKAQLVETIRNYVTPT